MSCVFTGITWSQLIFSSGKEFVTSAWFQALDRIKKPTNQLPEEVAFHTPGFSAHKRTPASRLFLFKGTIFIFFSDDEVSERLEIVPTVRSI